MTATEPSTTIAFDRLRDFAADAFCATGVSRVDAGTAADVLATTDAWGVFTHGTKLLAGYLSRLKLGGLRPGGVPRVTAEGGAWATLDGDSVLGQVASVAAMRLAVAKAKEQGIGYVGVFNTCHFGAASYYAALAAEEGCIGIAMANDLPTVAAPGSRCAVLGSNPFSYAVPAGRYRPLLLDVSTATVAGGKVYAAQARGDAVPANWIIGGDGRPTTDPSGFPHVGALQPAAGHKGYGMALLIEVLSGVLTGAALTRGVGSWMMGDRSKPTDHGAAFIALNVDAVMPAARFAERMESLIDEIHSSPVADGASRLLMPGEMEWERHDRAMREGITPPPDVVEKINEAASLVGLSSPFADN
jgi:ureidoglycolate dehydrogenase (NAD+)